MLTQGIWAHVPGLSELFYNLSIDVLTRKSYLPHLEEDIVPPIMCNLYSMTSNRDAIRELAKALNDKIGNLPELPGIYPDYLAPIVRLNTDGEREIVLARRGLPSLKDQPTEKPNRGTTNIRHPWFDDSKGYLGVGTGAWCRSIGSQSRASSTTGAAAIPGLRLARTNR
jgi:hypothetical protein